MNQASDWARHAWQLGMASVMASWALGCSAPKDDEVVGDADQSLRGGAVIKGATGVVELYLDGWECTGTLIAPNVVLTAAHCFRHLGSAAGVHEGTTEALITYYDPARGRREIHNGTADWDSVPSWDDGDGAAQANDDMAVIHVNGAFASVEFGGTTYHDYVRLYGDIGSTLDGQWLTEYGAGVHNYSGDDDGRLRVADFEIEDFDSNHLTADTRDLVSTCGGDSGGPLVYFVSQGGVEIPTVAGVLSNSDKDKDNEGEHCANNDAPNDNAYYCRPNWTRVQWLMSRTGVRCNTQLGGSRRYSRCFELPYVEDVAGEGTIERGVAAAVVSTIL